LGLHFGGAIALFKGGAEALAYAESRQYTEPLFVFVVMVMAASRPVLYAVTRVVNAMAWRMPRPMPLAQVWLALAIVPLFGSLINESAAMTLAALMLAPLVFQAPIPERLKYFVLGVFFL